MLSPAAIAQALSRFILICPVHAHRYSALLCLDPIVSGSSENACATYLDLFLSLESTLSQTLRMVTSLSWRCLDAGTQ